MMKVILAIVMLPILLVLLALPPWPDLDPAITSSFASLINILYAFNTVFPIDTFLMLFGLVVTIELGISMIRLGSQITAFISGHKTPLSK